MSLIQSAKLGLYDFYNQQRKKYHKSYYGNCAVLLYHRVIELKNDPQLLSVSPDNFDQQLKFLKSRYPVLTIEELKYHVEKQKKIPNNSIAITFDDGYADNYLEALPLLEKNQTQALFYIATGTLNTPNEYWWDAIERIILLNSNVSAQKEIQVGREIFDLDIKSKEKRFRLYTKLLPLLRRMDSAKREHKINELATAFNSLEPRESHRALTFDELKKLHASKSAIIGAHTHLHPSLGALTHDQQLQEIKTSKTILEQELRNKIIHFSFPFGTRADFNADTLAICKELEFEMVAANYPYIVHSHSPIFQFPRFLVRNWDIETFKREIKHFLN